jgi:hypothetical protein
MAKLHTAEDLSNGAPPGMAWTEAEAMDRPRRGPPGARCGPASDGRRLDDPREDVHRKHPWTSVHLPDMVLGAELK